RESVKRAVGAVRVAQPRLASGGRAGEVDRRRDRLRERSRRAQLVVDVPEPEVYAELFARTPTEIPASVQLVLPVVRDGSLIVVELARKVVASLILAAADVRAERPGVP